VQQVVADLEELIVLDRLVRQSAIPDEDPGRPILDRPEPDPKLVVVREVPFDPALSFR